MEGMPRQTQGLPKVAILLCTYHGQHYLVEQLESFAAQTYSNWEVWASDDGSQDGTHAILESYQEKWGVDRLSIHFGPAEGFAANFLSLTCKVGIESDYYAYSDQDDIWEPDRLSRALDWIKTVPPDIPVLYSSRTRYISKDGLDLGFSTLFKKPPSFRNALVQSIAGGNTMVFNQTARLLLIKTSSCLKVVSHDWWAYMILSGCGGRVFYDPYPGVRYRQHGNNLAGLNNTFLAKLQRVKELLAGRFKHWNQINLNAMNEMSHYLTDENRQVLALFGKARCGFIFSRIYNLYRSGVYRQTLAGNIGLFIAALFKKL
jgi:glycosyltransferase involved in cell wall biosynthesis